MSPILQQNTFIHMCLKHLTNIVLRHINILKYITPIKYLQTVFISLSIKVISMKQQV